MRWVALVCVVAVCSSCSLLVSLDDLRRDASSADGDGQAPSLLSLSFNPTNVVGGSPSTGTVVLTAAAPSNGASVTLSSTDVAVSVPTIVVVAGGATVATFTATTKNVQTTTTVEIDATLGATQKASLTLGPNPSSTIFTTQVPAVNNTTGNSYELGTQFMATTSGQIVAVRFWRAPSETGTHTGKLWSDTGTLLGSVLFANETATGWQEQALVPPVAMAANAKYRVSYNINVWYSKTDTGLATPITNGVLTGITGCSSAPGQWPNTINTTNFFADVRFN